MDARLSPDPLRDTVWRHAADRPTSSVYALLDGARDDRVYREVRRLDVDGECLYRGALDARLAAVAPYLVRLEPDHRTTEWVLEHAWGRSVGLLVVSPVPIRALRDHFRTLLKVKGATGRSLFFRFYDPRVLRVYLPTCLPNELDAVFGPVSEFVIETEDAGARVYGRHDDGHLRVSRLGDEAALPAGQGR